jgi:uncharacterized membrane protein YhaH (DUF805 family)
MVSVFCLEGLVQEAISWDAKSFITFPFVLMMVGVFLLVLLVPIVKLLRRTGHHAIWCLLAILPGLNFIAFWIFAFKPWPTDKTSAKIGD